MTIDDFDKNRKYTAQFTRSCLGESLPFFFWKSERKHQNNPYLENGLGIFFRVTLGQFFRIPVCLVFAAFGSYNLAFCM